MIHAVARTRRPWMVVTAGVLVAMFTIYLLVVPRTTSAGIIGGAAVTAASGWLLLFGLVEHPRRLWIWIAISASVYILLTSWFMAAPLWRIGSRW